jgi:cysteine synthase A
LTPAEESISGAVNKVAELAAANPQVFVPQQFENQDNPRVHYEETAG